MSSSSSGAPDWEKISEPRVDFDRRVEKWRLRMDYTASSKKPTIIVKSSYVSQHSRGGGSNGNFVAAELGTGEQRQEGQTAHRPTYPHLRTNSKRLQQKRWLLLFRKASSIPCGVCVFVPFCVQFYCPASCLRLLDVVPLVSRSLHRLARCLRAALRRYSSGADRIR